MGTILQGLLLICCSNTLPLSLVIPFWFKMRSVAKLPMVTMTLGLMRLMVLSRRTRQFSTSVFSGLRLFSGLQRMVFVMKMSSLVRLMVARRSWRIFPEAPQNGTPSLSSVAPGASPMNRIWAF